jgi:hypothetical protein
MSLLRKFLCALALSLAGGACAGPMPEGQQSALGFQSFDLPAEQTGAFELSFEATPLADKIDVFTGIAAADPKVANDVAAMVRFTESGTIDVRNGGSFRADQTLNYTAGKTYRMRMVVDLPKKTYSVFVTPPGQPEVALAKDYAFRSQQSSVQVLRKIVLAGFNQKNWPFTGPHRVNGVSLKPVANP